MRSREGQLSDNRPIPRNRVEKEKQLRDLKEVYANLKPYTSPELRASIATKIRELSEEMKQPAPPPREERGPRRPPRREPRKF
ncbi:hypothetical protein EOD42_03650 [Rhodovarius crocodyli]|uniref:Uncharacterized protein n=1 Tax=Rhodovarius crocodyli TaxID=1979269 RepID=A0A437MNJ4_9PROT|nr:hypothetical protein [Rhodovarius crocodyli]RVT99206.1 hypothetical protein EOD42_03650 [Rhodovarius crocodyli]